MGYWKWLWNILKNKEVHIFILVILVAFTMSGIAIVLGKFLSIFIGSMGMVISYIFMIFFGVTIIVYYFGDMI